jgi:hypothetical protein
VPGSKFEEVALRTFGAVIQSYVDQDVLPRNVITRLALMAALAN